MLLLLLFFCIVVFSHSVGFCFPTVNSGRVFLPVRFLFAIRHCVPIFTGLRPFVVIGPLVYFFYFCHSSTSVMRTSCPEISCFTILNPVPLVNNTSRWSSGGKITVKFRNVGYVAGFFALNIKKYLYFRLLQIPTVGKSVSNAGVLVDEVKIACFTSSLPAGKGRGDVGGRTR